VLPFPQGLITKWLFIARTIPDIGYLFQPIKDFVKNCCIPSVTGHSLPCDFERALFALPANWAVWGL